MSKKELEQGWRELSEEVVVGMREWREQHPRATLREIEAVLDERLARLRVRMLQDAALVSEARDWRESEEPVCCPECGGVLKARGQQVRRLQTQGGQEMELKREYGECSACGAGLFPPG